MIELASARKNKICLTDYNYRRDIENRLLMAHFSSLDQALLEEILYSPIKVAVRKLAKNIDAQEEAVAEALEKFSRAGLLAIEGDSIVVDKEMRKYFEAQASRFDPDFKPDMEFLQGLLKKVPIHVLPVWYAIPRTSNNIFDSLIEKYLQTPQIFHRYLMELNLGDPTLAAIVQDVYRSEGFKLSSKEIIDKYGLSREQFEESMLYLEFNFLCCLCYEKEGENWKETVTPFHEWREYLAFLRNTTPRPLADLSKAARFRPHDFSFVLDMAAVLHALSRQLVPANEKGWLLLASKLEEFEGPLSYVQEIVHKLQLLKLAAETGGKLEALPSAQEWLEMRLENRALFLYRHPYNSIGARIPAHLQNEKAIRDAEKSLTRVLYSGWVLFDDFVQGVAVPIGDRAPVSLKKCGKTWRYVLPECGDDEKKLLKAVVFEWLFEAGITAVGTYEGKDCFCVTPFGQSLFG